MIAQIPCLEYNINHYIYKAYSSLHNGTIHSQHAHTFEIIGKERLINMLLLEVAQNDLRCIRRVCNKLSVVTFVIIYEKVNTFKRGLQFPAILTNIDIF